MPQNIKLANIDVIPGELPNQVKSLRVVKVEENTFKPEIININYNDLLNEEKIVFDNFINLVNNKTT